MDNKTKILFAVFLLVVFALGFFCYYKFVLQKEYLVYAEADCDPSVEVCFIYNCDLEAGECSGDPEEDTYYYKEVRRMANQFPDCNPQSEGCLIDRCGEGEIGCSVSLCNSEDAESVCTSVDDFASKELPTESDAASEVSSDENTDAGVTIEIEK